MVDVNEFLSKGYIRYENALPSDLLEKWRAIADDLEREAMEDYSKGQLTQQFCVIEDPVGPRLMRFEELYKSHLDELIELLSIQPMLEIMKELSGPSSVVVYSDLLYKHQHPHPVIKWHQGAPHSRKFPYLNIGIYLDDANVDDGCLRYVPGTQFELQDISEIEQNFGWNPPGVVQQPAKAGDILVQDMMILHSSEPKRSPGPRRTIYVEVRPHESVSEDQMASQEWLDSRRLLMNEVLNYRDQSIFDDKEKSFFDESTLTKSELQTLLKAAHLTPIPAVYSYQNEQGPDYPIPGDLL